jgi:hypothetical protein
MLSTTASWTNCSGGPTAYILGIGTGVIAPPAYYHGMLFTFRPNANNTVSANTVNVGSLGVKSLVRESGSALQAADLTTAHDAVIRFDNGNDRFLLLDYSLSAGSADLPNGFISGMTMGRNSAETTTFQDIDTQIGSCRDAADSQNLVLGTALIKQFDASYQTGTNLGGFANSLGARSTGTWYRYFAIGRDDTGATDCGFDSIANDDAATLLIDANLADSTSAWTKYRQLGWVRTTDADATELVPFSNSSTDPNSFYWSGSAGTEDVSFTQAGSAARGALTLNYAAPETSALMDWFAFSKANSGACDVFGILQPIGFPDEVPSSTAYNIGHTGIAGNGGVSGTPSTANSADAIGTAVVRVDSSRQFNSRFTIGGGITAGIWCTTTGFRFER